MKEIYLDNSATTRPLPGVVEYMTRVLTDNYGNPSSLHNRGLAAEKILKQSRNIIAARLGVDAGEIYFTSGGTESNNLAIKGIAYKYSNRGKHLITTSVEHASVIDTFKALEDEGYEVTYLKTDENGLISTSALRKALRPETILVSIIHVNNELGSINPLKEAATIIKDNNPLAFFHVDAVQSFGKILLKPVQWQIDSLTISAHKIHGPKGVGALFLKKGIDIKPLFNGGGQENGLRSGTENMPGIAGFIPAVDALPELSSSNRRSQKLDRLKNYFLHKIKKELPEARVNSPVGGAPHIVSLSFPGIKAEVLVHSMAGEGVYLSTGSACHSRQQDKSHVLKAIGLTPELIDGTIRVSFSHFNTEEELNLAVSKIKNQLQLFF